MPNRRKDDKKYEEDETSGDAGGQSGHIEFRDFISNKESLRDDLLTPEEKRLHEVIHESRVKKQKNRLENRQAVKEGKVSLASYKQGLSAAAEGSRFLAHPAFENSVQFHANQNSNELPHNTISDTNEDKRDELQFQLRIQPRPGYASPKPRPN